jgi:cobalamin biosynthesis protein CobT
MIWNLSLGDAMDAVDVYGPDADLWPRADKDALEAMLASNEEFAEYVSDVKRIEDMLANWEDDLDGVDFGDDEEQDEPRRGPSDQDHDEPESSDSPDETDTETPNADEAQAEVDPATDAGEEMPELDPDQIKDMEEMLADFIRQQMQNASPTEFRVFTRDYDKTVEIIAPDGTSIEAIDQAIAASAGPLQKDLRRLIAARSQVQRIPGMRSGRLHGPALHRIMAGDDRVFTRRQEAPTLDTAVTLLIDCSGSMEGSRLKLATEAAYALGNVLNRLNVPFEILGFTDLYNSPVTKDKQYQAELEEADDLAKIIRALPLTMPKFKAFAERWAQPVQRRFAHVFNRGGAEGCGIKFGSTPEGCGLEFAARRLLARKEKRKIMISMTDGQPGGHVYNPRSYSDHSAYPEQSRLMVKAIEAAGIDLVGIGIQHNGPADYYTNHMEIQNLAQMPKQLIGLLKKFMVG